MTKKNNVWVKISAIAGAIVFMLIILGKVLGFFEQTYYAVSNVKYIPTLKVKVASIESTNIVTTIGLKNINVKLDAICKKWDIIVLSDSTIF